MVNHKFVANLCYTFWQLNTAVWKRHGVDVILSWSEVWLAR